MTQGPDVEEVTEQIRETLMKCASARIRRILLYGSRVTGSAREDSDFDILVIEKGPVDKFEESLRLRKALRELPCSVDVWVMSEEEFEETKNVIGGLAYPANKYGVLLK